MAENFESMIYRQETEADRQAAARASNFEHQSDTVRLALGRGDYSTVKQALSETNSCDWAKLFPHGDLRLSNEEKQVKTFAAHFAYDRYGTTLEVLESVNNGIGLFFIQNTYVPRMTITGDVCNESKPRT